MPEEMSNLEFVQKIREQRGAPERAGWVEILESATLAIVAVATAWSGFNAAKWDGLSAKQYTLASRATMLAQEKATLAGQDRLYDIITFNDWLEAKLQRNAKLAAFYQRRFRPEYAAAFTAWLKLDPFNNPSVVSGPIYMREYTNSNAQESAKLNEESQRSFERGVSMRETSEEYVKVTVFLATVLLLTAIGQRFKIFALRVALVMVAVILLVSSAYYLLILPRA